MKTIDKINKKRVPKHVAVIMDGNGRWAKEHGKERLFGHINGVESVRSCLKAATKIGVKYLTLYAFSSENWNRPEEEVFALMELLVSTLAKELDELDNNGVKLESIGNLKRLPKNCRTVLESCIEKTKKNNSIQLTLALSYGSRDEIINSIKKIADSVKEGAISTDQIDEKLVTHYLDTKNIPDPELLIRTSGEQRLSNFLLWQIAYTEFCFSPVFWPEFTEEEFYKCVVEYQERERRFGKITEQVENKI